MANPMTKEDESAELRNRFASNLRRMMEERNLTVRETAKNAGITDFKRFYRWASMGISRATHEHDADLERLQKFFGLSSLGQFWTKPIEPLEERSSLSEKLRIAGQIDCDYESAFQLIVILRGMDVDQAVQFRTHINELFRETTENQTAEEILEPKTGEQIVSFLEINCPEELERILRNQNVGREEYVSSLDAAILQNGGVSGLNKGVVE